MSEPSEIAQSILRRIPAGFDVHSHPDIRLRLMRKIDEAILRVRNKQREDDATIAETEPEFPGPCPPKLLQILIKLGPVESHRLACRTTKKKIAERILAERESEP